MKKNYVSPQVSFMSLGVNPLSAACTYISNMTQNNCPALIPGWGGETVFIAEGMCDWTPGDGINVCYDVPTATSNVFES